MKDAPKTRMVGDGKDIYIYYDGLCVAKRGHPNTPQAKTWIPLVLGYTVISSGDNSTLTVKIDTRLIGNQ